MTALKFDAMAILWFTLSALLVIPGFALVMTGGYHFLLGVISASAVTFLLGLQRTARALPQASFRKIGLILAIMIAVQGAVIAMFAGV